MPIKNGYGTGSPGRGKGIAFLRAHLSYQGTDCVHWPYHTQIDGYGNLGYNGGGMKRAHRLMCELAHGKPPTPKHEAAHSCGVARCVNPKHLSWKTRSENEIDKRVHGTARGGHGTRTRLTAEQITDIRENKGKLPQHLLAKKHGLKRAGVRYWQSTGHDPYPPGQKRMKRLNASSE